MGFFRRSASRVDCHYCSTTLTLLPPTPNNAKGKQRAVEPDEPVGVGTREGGVWCSVCGQISRWSSDGEVLDDPSPARFDSALNERSFAVRASTSEKSLPPSFPTPQTTPFCRTCLSNQSLQLHLLASYPSSSASDSGGEDDDPSTPLDYPPLEEYRRSLDLRYPLVCAACAPAVAGVIKERDYKVKAQALGWRLRESERRREREERLGEKARKRAGRRWVLEGIAWRVRGAAWVGSGAGTVLWAAAALLSPSSASSLLPSPSSSYPNLVLVLCLLSILWAAWDPTWDRLRTERARGKVVKVQERKGYLALQMAAYFLRLFTCLALRFSILSPTFLQWVTIAILFISLLALVSPFFLPRLSHPPPVRLTASSPSSPAPASPADRSVFPHPHHPNPDPLEPLAHLSLSRRASLYTLRGSGSEPPNSPLSSGGRSSARNARGGGGGGTGGGLGGIRPRIPSFGLGSIPWGRDLVGGGEEGDGMNLDPDAMDEDERGGYGGKEENENSMDWAPLPPLSPPSRASGSGSASPAPFPATSTSTAGHVSFARQRFVPPDLRKPTGLEGMFERVGLSEDERVGEERREVQRREGEGERGWWRGWWR
ncbi:hypothetical protein JCM10213_000724 [Rhodosporidiobolus nylandii]